MRLVTGFVVGAVAAGVVAYLILGGAPRGNPHSALIVLEGATGTDCKGKVDPFRIGNKRNLKVFWNVFHEEAGCDPDGEWELELRFDNADDGTPWNKGRIRIKKNGTTPWTIEPDTNYGKFPYHVWMIESAREYEIVDPELEIER